MILSPAKQPAQLQLSLLRQLSTFRSFFLLCLGWIYGVLINSIFYLLTPHSCESPCYREPGVLQRSLLRWETACISLSLGAGEQAMPRRSRGRGDWTHRSLATAVSLDSCLPKWFPCVLGSQADWEGVVLMEIRAYKSANQPQEMLPITTSKI